MNLPSITLSPTGNPDHSTLEGNIRRSFDQVTAGVNGLAATGISYVPGNPSDWVSPAPTTVQQALDRLAAAAGAHPVP